jgi:hypothetical protein
MASTLPNISRPPVVTSASCLVNPCACDLSVRKRAEKAVCASTGVPHHLPDPLELERVEVGPHRAADSQAGPVHRPPVYLMGEHLVSVIRQAHRAPVTRDRPSHVGAPRSSHDPRAIWDLNGKHFLATYLNNSRCHSGDTLGRSFVRIERVCMAPSLSYARIYQNSIIR